MTKARTVGQRRADKRQDREQVNTPPQAPSAPVEAPTDQARTHGAYTRSDAPRAPYVNAASTYLGQLERNGSITPSQRKGGEAFADCYRLAHGVSGKDSTQPRIGGVYHETASDAEKMIARKAKLHRILNMGEPPSTYALLVTVAVFELRLGRDRGRNKARYAALRAGLDACAVVFDVPA